MDDAQHRDGGHDAAVIGVVIAGVLSSFVIPGPFDWGSFLIGVLLLAVLFGYADVPEHRGDRRAVAGAAAVGFCLLLMTGAVLDQWQRGDDNGTKVSLFSGWPAERVDDDGDPGTLDVYPKREDADRPEAQSGFKLLATWLVLSLLVYGAWLRGAEPRPKKPTAASSG
jgi:hypothetical protein